MAHPPAPAPSFALDGQVALVTGASRGIGRVLCSALAAAGADVVVAVREPADGAAVAAEVEAHGRRAPVERLDVTSRSEIDSAVAGAVEAFGRIDILVNNAGLGPENAAEDVTEEDFDLTCAVNLKGTFFVSQAVGRQMLRQGSGRIVNLGSQAGFVALPGESVYCMTKAAISHLTKCLAVEWGPRGITVNAVAPTFIVTPGTAAALDDPAMKADILERIAALHRVGDPMDVAGAVVFLASPAAALITGHTILIDGGWTAR
jgi:NAD(P)-dependent dehydrogenase (short-subunit alcohol dehydrogenase family)